MQYSEGNAGAGQGQYNQQGYVPQPPSYVPPPPGFAPQQPGYAPRQAAPMATQGNGLMLALGGGIAVAIGALLPFISNIQETVDGTAVATGDGIDGGGRAISFLFGLILIGFALWIRYRPALRRGIAIAALISSLLGLAGYCLFAVIGLVGFTVDTGFGTGKETWNPSIGALLSIAGCAACVIAAIGLLRTSRRTPVTAPGAGAGQAGW